MAYLLAHRDGDRGFPNLWFLRLSGLVITIVGLGLTADGAASFGAIDCNVPGKLGFNLAVCVISFIVLVYFVFATGPNHQFRLLPWVIFAQLPLDAVMFIFWLAAASTSQYNCDDLCNACNGQWDIVDYGAQECVCYIDVFYKRGMSPNFDAKRGLLDKRRRASRSSGSGSAATGFASIMTVIFAICLGTSILWFTQSRKNARAGTRGTTAPPPVVGEPIKHEEAGLPASTAAPDLASPHYQQQQQQQQAYAGQHQQQPMQQQYTGNSGPSPITQQYTGSSGPPPSMQQHYAGSTGQAPHQMSSNAGPLQEHYSTPPPPEGTVEMPPVGQRTLDGSGAPEVRS